MKSQTPDTVTLIQHEDSYRINQKFYFDQRHAAKDLPRLSEGQAVWIPGRKQHGTVKDHYCNRSYIVKTNTGEYRRNRVQLNPMPNAAEIRIRTP